MEELSLYIHIPFCKSKCHYCDFLSFFNEDEKIDTYFLALLMELDYLNQIKDKYIIKTIFIGGGTPTYVHDKYIIKVIEKIRSIMVLHKDAELSIEGNPGTFHKNTLLPLKGIGLNRLSIGLQCWQDELLTSIGRTHTKKEFLQSYDAAISAGFTNINIDLIFGLPRQSLFQWQETLEKVVALCPAHLSCYSLKIEEGTAFGKQLQNKEIYLDDVLDRQMYHEARRYLWESGYEQYEISNFMKDGFQCVHNLVYWEVKPYLGFGLGAHSYFEKYRFHNEKNLNKYIEKLFAGNTIKGDKILVHQQNYKEEYIFLGLRKIKGIYKKDYKERFSKSISEEYQDEINRLISLELLEEDEVCIKLTSKGLDFANQVFRAFLKN
ncbi:MAG: radical SAM family heme chaperone HemW [Eubacteriales bacterium]